MTEQKTDIAEADEIDLIFLLERAILFLRKYRIIFIIAIVVGVALGCLNYFTSTKMYKSRLILHSSFLTNLEEIEIIDYWDELLKRNEYGTLSQTLKCSETMLHKLASIEGSEILKNYSASNPNGFYIDVKILDNAILPELQKTIVDGLNNTEYVKQKIFAKKENLKELINRTSLESRKLDSIKTNIENIIGTKGSNPSLLMLNVTEINKERIDLNEKLLNYQEELTFNSGVQILQSFVPLNTPVSTSLKVMIVLGLLLCLAIAFILALLNSVRIRLNKRSSSNDRS